LQRDESNWQNQLEEAVSKSIITDMEAKELKEVRAMVTEIIAVDDFEDKVLRMGVSDEGEPATEEAA